MHCNMQHLYDNIDAYLTDTTPIPKGPLPQHTPSGTPRSTADAPRSTGAPKDEGAALSREQLPATQAPTASSDEAAAAAVAPEHGVVRPRSGAEEDVAGAAATEHLQDRSAQSEASAVLHPGPGGASDADAESEAGEAGPVDTVDAAPHVEGDSEATGEQHSYFGEAHTLGTLYAGASAGAVPADVEQPLAHSADGSGPPTVAPGDEAADATLPEELERASSAGVSPLARDPLAEGAAAVQHIAQGSSDEDDRAHRQSSADAHADQQVLSAAQNQPFDESLRATSDPAQRALAAEDRGSVADASAPQDTTLPPAAPAQSSTGSGDDGSAASPHQSTPSSPAAPPHAATLAEQYGVADADAVAGSGVHGLFEQAVHTGDSDVHDDAELRALSGGEASVTYGRPTRGLPVGESSQRASADPLTCPALHVATPAVAACTRGSCVSSAQASAQLHGIAVRAGSSRAQAVAESPEPARGASASGDALDEAATDALSERQHASAVDFDTDALRMASVSSSKNALAATNGMRTQSATAANGADGSAEPSTGGSVPGAKSSDAQEQASESGSERSGDMAAGSGHPGLQHNVMEGYVPVRCTRSHCSAALASLALHASRNLHSQMCRPGKQVLVAAVHDIPLSTCCPSLLYVQAACASSKR